MESPKLQEVYEFVRGHLPLYATWSKKELIEWLEWVAKNDFVLISLDRGRLVGVGIARSVEEPSRGLDPYHYFTGTKHVFVDLGINKPGYQLKNLVDYIPVRFPRVETVSFQRGDSPTPNTVRTYKYNRFKKLIK